MQQREYAVMRIDDGLRALAHPARRQMLRLVQDHERTVGELATETGLSQPGTSQHLRVLRDAGLVQVRGDANRRFYSADVDALSHIQAALSDFWDDRLGALARLAEERSSRPITRKDRSA